jgi:hypothetical protein
MIMNKLLDKILSEVSLDERVFNGMFNIGEDAHMEALRDYLIKKGINGESVIEFSNKVLEGKYPERQAYNAKGILVTFPTPEYKDAAIKRGTHFEENPVKKMSNIFSAPDPITQRETEPAKEKSKTEPKTNLPVSQAGPPETPTPDAQQTDPQPKTTAAPQQTPSPQPQADTTQLEAPPQQPPKSPEEKEADKKAIKTIIRGDDYILDEIVTYVQWNAPHIMEDINKRLL